jgi:hypothetical protein
VDCIAGVIKEEKEKEWKIKIKSRKAGYT